VPGRSSGNGKAPCTSSQTHNEELEHTSTMCPSLLTHDPTVVYQGDYHLANWMNLLALFPLSGT